MDNHTTENCWKHPKEQTQQIQQTQQTQQSRKRTRDVGNGSKIPENRVHELPENEGLAEAGINAILADSLAAGSSLLLGRVWYPSPHISGGKEVNDIAVGERVALVRESWTRSR
jgi:hypothetical protein